jgi:hypothetical protein
MFSIYGRIRSLRKRWMLSRFRRLHKKIRCLTEAPGVCLCSMCYEPIRAKVSTLRGKAHLLQVRINRLSPGTLPVRPVC